MVPAELMALSFLLGSFGAWIITRFARKLKLVDHPNERSSHSLPTPKGGGIGILGALVFISLLTSNPLLCWVPAACIALIGFLTDIFEFPPKVRLTFQFAAAGILAADVLNRHMPHLNGMVVLALVILVAIYIVGTANFYNFMDGINGIAGVTGIVGFALLGFYLHIMDGHSSLKTEVISMSLACAGFLPFNMPSARVFMGDVGSILLGFLFAAVVVVLSKSLLDFVCLASFLFPFYADELTTMAVRIRDGENLLRPHRKHLYQLLANEKRISHWKVSVLYGLVQLAVGLTVLFLKPFGMIVILSLLLAYLVVFILASSAVRKNLAASS